MQMNFTLRFKGCQNEKNLGRFEQKTARLSRFLPFGTVLPLQMMANRVAYVVAEQHI